MNLTLLALADCLNEEGKNVPDEILNPDKYADISKEHLTLLREYLDKANSTPALLEANPNAAIAPTSPATLTNGEASNVAPGTLSGFRETLKQLGVQYVATAAGYDISDSFFLALDQALAERNAQNLSERIDGYLSEFDAAVDSIQRTAQERQEWEKETLGKFSKLTNFNALDAKLASLRKS
jgi:hypothetical protein